MQSAQVVVVGAGPAGSTLACLLARHGMEVLLLDQARFPRDKPCGEYLNPAAVALLQRLGLLSALGGAGARIVVGAHLTAPGSPPLRVPFPAWGSGLPAWGLSLPRLHLDAALLHAARGAGVRVHEGFRVDDLLHSGERVAGVVGRGQEGAVRVRSRIVVGADGSRSVVARRLGLARSPRTPGRIGLVAHYQDVAGDDWVEMHAGRRGYCGLGYSADGGANVALVAEPEDLPLLRGRTAAFFEDRLAEFPWVARRVAGGRPVGRLQVTGSMSSAPAGVTAPGALLVGDAAGFFDPYTGEGVAYALRAAELAAEAVFAAVEGGAREERAAFRVYAARRRHELAPRLRVSRVIQAFLRRPWALQAVFRRFAADPGLAQRLIGVTAGVLPPAAVLSPTYAAALLLARPQSRARDRQERQRPESVSTRHPRAHPASEHLNT
jgi:flavin-dependent dehydrogenase